MVFRCTLCCMPSTNIYTCVQVVQEERCRAMCPGYEDPFRNRADGCSASSTGNGSGWPGWRGFHRAACAPGVRNTEGVRTVRARGSGVEPRAGLCCVETALGQATTVVAVVVSAEASAGKVQQRRQQKLYCSSFVAVKRDRMGSVAVPW